MFGFLASGTYGNADGNAHEFRVYRVPTTTVWRAYIDVTLLTQADFEQTSARPWALSSSSHGDQTINHHYYSIKYGQIGGQTAVFWYYWPSLTSDVDAPYYIQKINDHDFYAKGGG